MQISNTQTLGEIAGAFPAAVRILEDRGLDYCCGGKLSLGDACRQRGLDPATVAGEIESASEVPTGTRDWRAATLTELAHHIVDRHHRFLEAELPRLSARLDKVRSAHGTRDGEVLERIAKVFDALRDELELHTRKEEMVLFPWIERMEETRALHHSGAPAPFGTVANPIHCMEAEHENAGQALAELRRITSGYTPPSHACATYRALYAGLEELERDLHLHIHLENNILFPGAMRLE